ncbi:MAG: serine/threonine-protein kinase [Deltaproteobacteria bacterium]|nr:serine/threonine-protein kinase [Deltaproteobacteria bacterium]
MARRDDRTANGKRASHASPDRLVETASGTASDTIGTDPGADDALAPTERSDRALTDAAAGEALAHTAAAPIAPSTDALIGTTVARYRIVSRLGAGGMGVVYGAIDPALDRRVALKILPPLTGAQGIDLEARLRREAQALAKLEHPNVISVYDVGVAAHSVYVAMQLVDGGTLSEHLAAAKPAPAQVIALFTAAARGLAAAHAAGIIHRDVKPSNVLVDRGGRVYVSDFGLARAADGEAEARDVTTDSGSLLHDELTRAGAVMGTPLYMSPEQHRGDAVTAATDQFSLCVSLWQALFGAHPFATGKWRAREALIAMGQDKVAEPPRVRGVPVRVVRALRRGLRHAPDARWPSMDALVAELEPRSRAAWAWGGLAVTGMAGVAVATALMTGGPDETASCDAALDRMTAVWPAREPALRKALADAGFADSADRVRDLLGDYVGRWRAARKSVCEVSSDTRGNREQRATCLDQQQHVVGSLLDYLTTAGVPQRARAVSAVNALPELSTCDSALLGSLDPPPAAHLAEIRDQEEALARARLLIETEAQPQARPLVDAVVAAARRFGYPPLLARALHQQTRLAMLTEDPRAAAYAAETAEVAVAARLDLMAAQAYLDELAIAVRAPDLRQIEILLPVARAATMRTRDLATIGSFHRAAGMAALSQGRARDADALCRQSRIDGLALGGTSGRDLESGALNCLAQTALRRSALEEAAEWSERALAVDEATYGPNTYGTLSAVFALAQIRRRQGKLTEARELVERAVRINERIVGVDSPALGSNLRLIAQLDHQTGRIAEGLAVAQRALAIAQASEQPPAMGTFASYMTLAQLHRANKDRVAMRAAYEAALALGEKVLAPDDPNLAALRVSFGSALSEDGEIDRALALLAQAEEVWTRTGNPRAASVISIRGEILQEHGRCAEAIPLFERAVAALTASGSDPVNLESTRYNLADCQWQANVDRPAARAAMQALLAEVRARGDDDKENLDAVTAWLRQHR